MRKDVVRAVFLDAEFLVKEGFIAAEARKETGWGMRSGTWGEGEVAVWGGGENSGYGDFSRSDEGEM